MVVGLNSFGKVKSGQVCSVASEMNTYSNRAQSYLGVCLDSSTQENSF